MMQSAEKNIPFLNDVCIYLFIEKQLHCFDQCRALEAATIAAVSGLEASLQPYF